MADGYCARCGVQLWLNGKCGACKPDPAGLAEVAERMADTLRGILAVVDQEQPYPWQGGALKQQIREDITAYELLGLDTEVPR